jgi:hypothetical protein
MATAGGRSPGYDHYAWGFGGDFIWMIFMIGIFWACWALWARW